MQMLEPIVLDPNIVTVAKQWLDSAILRWNEPEGLISAGEHDVRVSIGEASLTGERYVRLNLGKWESKNWFRHTPRAITFPPNELRNAPKDGFYNIVLNTLFPPNDNQLLLVILLHEIVHSVDPLFDTDCKLRKKRKDQGLPPTEEYELRSEQLAFSGMWIEELRKLADQFPEKSGEEMIDLLLGQCVEFDYFLAHLSKMKSTHLLDQLKYLFNQIVTSLR